MSDVLQAFGAWVAAAVATRNPTLLIIADHKLQLIEWQGDERHFGLSGLGSGMALSEALAVLGGLDLGDRQPRYWRFVQLPGIPACHIDIAPLAQGWGLALHDAAAEHAQWQAMQQTTHELLLLRAERERLVEELSAANALKRDFIARMSHEFRTPLTTVIGYSDQLIEGGGDAVMRRHIGAINRAGRYLLNLIENLLEQARLESDQFHLNPGARDLCRIMDQLEQLLLPLAEQKQLGLTFAWQGARPPMVRIDQTRLEQILVNLIGNAIKFTETGAIDVGLNWANDRLAVAVADTGPGIPEQEQQAIFQAFRQGLSRQHSKGAGLGLAISRSLVQAMGGDIRLRSRPGAGACFEFDIDAPAMTHATLTALAGRRILIADDDPDLLALLMLYLESAGCEVIAVETGPALLATAASCRPDLIILDLDLGTSDGITIARELRDQGYAGKTVILSASPDETHKDPSPALVPDSPIDAYWTKPMPRAALIDGISRLIRQTPTASAPPCLDAGRRPESGN